MLCFGNFVLLFFVAFELLDSNCGLDVRLVGDGFFTNMGRLEVSLNGTWYTVCSINSNTVPERETAAALQVNLGCKKLRRIYYPWFGVGNGTKCLNNFYCPPLSTLFSCSFSLIDCCSLNVIAYFCDQETEIANSSLRLAGGTNISGRVEVQFQDVWGSVDANGWDAIDSKIVCRSLGLPWRASLAVKNELYGQTKEKSWITGTDCTGLESNLYECLFNVQGEKATLSYTAGVICADSIPVRLVNGVIPTSGRVEVYIDGKWGSVIARTTSGITITAKVICDLLGTPSSTTKALVQNSEFYGKSKNITWLTDLYCSSGVFRLENCNFKISGFPELATNFAVVCQDVKLFSIRLLNNHTANRGYVEVLFGGMWGTIRPDYNYWNKNAATVACRELGLPNSASFPVLSSMFGPLYSLRWLERIICSGTEVSLLNCYIHLGGVSYYDSTMAGVICTDKDKIQLRTASNTSAGRVEILLDDKWGGINKKAWTEKTASMFCKEIQKPYSRAIPVLNDVFGFSEWEWFVRVSCSGTESSFIDCANQISGKYNSGSAGVVCTCEFKAVAKDTNYMTQILEYACTMLA